MSASEEHQRGAGHAGVPSGERYRIRVEGHLDGHWSAWLDGMTIIPEEDGTTRLCGNVTDQAALHGLLEKLRDLRLPIVLVERVRSAGNEVP